MSIDKIVCTWSGFIGPPGSSVFYASASQGGAIQPRIASFWAAIGPYLPSSVVVTTPNSGETLDEATGKQTGAWGGGTQTAVTGTGSSVYASVAGAMVRWETNQFANGRRVRGRTFIVPLNSTPNYSAGVINTTTANAIQAAANTLWSTLPGQLVVYSRPVYDHSTTPPTLKRPGTARPVTSSACPTKVVYLSSRRD